VETSEIPRRGHAQRIEERGRMKNYPSELGHLRRKMQEDKSRKKVGKKGKEGRTSAKEITGRKEGRKK